MSTIYRPVSRGVYPLSRRHAGQLGPAALRVSNLLAIGSILFGSACAAFVPASLEQRIGAVFLFGLIPAIGFHGGGLVLSLLFGFSSELAERIANLCFRYFARLLTATMLMLNTERCTTKLQPAAAELPAVSVTRKRKDTGPADPGLPLSTPSLLNDMPEGKDPITAQL